MSMQNRAAQFAPFAALSGYDESVRETQRLTDRRIEPDESEIAAINDKLQYLSLTMEDPQQISITYFVKDASKEGGSYETITGILKKIDAVSGNVVMDDGTKIPVSDIYAIEI